MVIMGKKVGKVTEEEKETIKQLFERQSGLNELAKVLTPDNQELYEKLVSDLGTTKVKFDNWWSTMRQKYNWEGTENGHWVIDFETCEVYLETI